MDVLLIVIYIIVVFLVLYQMSLELENKLEDKVEILLDEEVLQSQTQAQIASQKNPRRIEARSRTMSFGKKKKKVKRPVLVLVFDADKEIPVDPVAKELQKTLDMKDDIFQEYLHPKMIIRIAPTKEQPLKKVQFISVFVSNDTADMQVYIDWDSSSIEMMTQGNRVIRSTPNIPIDLSQPQVHTVVNPGMTVTSSITVEKRFSRNSEATTLFAPSQPMLNLKELVEISKMTDPTEERDNIQPLYTLDLKILIKHRAASNHEYMNILVPFIFKMKIKVDEPAFPPMRWWLRNFGKKRTKKGNWFWGSRPPEPKGD